MTQHTFRRMLTFVALAAGCATLTRAQAGETVELPVRSAASSDAPVSSTWQGAQQDSSSKHKLFVVTVDQPNRRQSCRVQSFTADKLVCARGIGRSKTYLPQEVSALIVPGDHDSRIMGLLGFNAGLGTAIWATVVLVATCPACAAGTALVAYFCFGAAGAMMIADGQQDRLLYLAPGKELTIELRF